jgi:hypothetical protein
MSRSLAERAKDGMWWAEQVGHAALGWVIVWLFVLIGVSPVVAVGLSCWAGAVRELTQNFGDIDGSLGDTLVDSFAWMLGAVIAGL